MHQNPRDGSLE